MSNKSTNLLSQFENRVKSAADSHNLEGFLSLAPKPETYVQFRQYLVYGMDDVIERLERKFRRFSDNFRLVNSATGGFKLFRKYGKKQVKEVSGYISLMPGGKKNFYRITTVSYASFWEDVVKYYLRKSYPVFTPLVFRQEELRKALAALEFNLGPQYRIVISDATLKEKLNKPSNRQDTERWWTRMPYQDVFDEAEERGQWFKGLQFVIEKQHERRQGRYVELATGRLSKDGEVKFDWFYDHVNSGILNTLEQFAFERMELLNNRGIVEKNYIPSKPIVVYYKNELFQDLEQVRRFGDAISKYPNSSKALLHSNPYFHASVADFLDGSSFEVWVLSTNKVVLVPQAKASEQAFERLIGHIFTEFREGEIAEYE